MTDKVPIELKPYTALQILTFLTEIKEDLTKHEECKSLLNCIDEFHNEVCLKIRDDQITDAVHERKINQSLGFEPSNYS